MSGVPYPNKFTCLSVSNTLSAKEIWTSGLYDKKGKTNILVELQEGIKKMKELEKTINDLLKKVETPTKTKSDDTDLKSLVKETIREISKTEPVIRTVEKVVQVAGPKGERGRNAKTNVLEMDDVDTTDLKDGSVLVWNATEKKFKPMVIFE